MSETPEGYSLYETPPFLRAKAEQTLALMRERGTAFMSALLGIDVILAPLTPLDDNHCDGCERLVGKAMVQTGRIYERLDNTPVEFVFGVCPDCLALMDSASGE